MKRLQLLVLALFVMVAAGRLQADVATEGEMDVRVELLNGDDFPGFKFFIKYQDYYYDMGYQAGDVTQVFLEKGKIVETGDRHNASLLYAVDANGNEFVTKEEVGGSVIDHNKNVYYHVQQLKILKVENGEITFKVAATKKMNDKDEVIKVMKGEVEMNWIIIVVPAVCLLGLVAFFVVRRRSRASA